VRDRHDLLPDLDDAGEEPAHQDCADHDGGGEHDRIEELV
jgi:hypothetical protein